MPEASELSVVEAPEQPADETGSLNSDQNSELGVAEDAIKENSNQPSVSWTPLVEQIRAGNSDAMTELYRTFSRGIRYYLCRQLGTQDLEDKLHDTFLIVVQAIQRDELRDPEKLMGFVRTVVRRQVAAYIDDAVHTRRDFTDLEVGGRVPDIRGNPEQRAISDEKADIMAKVLGGISRRDREILTRFYLHEQTQDQICREMALTETQFRLLKSRAKARFGEMGKRKIERGRPTLLLRKV